GRSRWTLQLLANELIRLVDVETISREAVRRRLEESELKPWREKVWCIPKVDAEPAALYDALDAVEARLILRKLEFHYTCVPPTPATGAVARLAHCRAAHRFHLPP